LAHLGEFSKAEKYFRHCIKLDNGSVQAHYGLGRVLMHFDKNDLAFDQFKIVTEMERSNYKAWCQMGIIRLELQRFEEAAKYIKRSIEYK